MKKAYPIVEAGALLTLVDVDFTDYRLKHDNRTER